MKTIFHKADSRGYAKHGWLTTHHSFSFASYYNPTRMGFGALRVINDDTIAPGTGFGKHSHDNMEIITIPLSGALTHEDSMGNKETIATGEIQVMSAGTGVAHAEFNASVTEPVTLLQIWIIPKRRNVEPRYEQKKFNFSDQQNIFTEAVGKYGESNLGIYQDAHLSLGRFDAGKKISYEMKTSGNGAYFFVIDGEITLADTFLGRRDALGVWETGTVIGEIKQDALLLIIEVPLE